MIQIVCGQATERTTDQREQTPSAKHSPPAILLAQRERPHRRPVPNIPKHRRMAHPLARGDTRHMHGLGRNNGSLRTMRRLGPMPSKGSTICEEDSPLDGKDLILPLAGLPRAHQAPGLSVILLEHLRSPLGQSLPLRPSRTHNLMPSHRVPRRNRALRQALLGETNPWPATRLPTVAAVGLKDQVANTMSLLRHQLRRKHLNPNQCSRHILQSLNDIAEAMLRPERAKRHSFQVLD